MGIPRVALPYLNPAEAAHPAYQRSLDRLRGMGVLIGSCEPHRRRVGGAADCFRLGRGTPRDRRPIPRRHRRKRPVHAST